MLYTFIIIILAQYYPLAASANNGSVYFNDRVHYTLSYLSNDQLPIDHEHTVRVTTSDAETYQCVLPAIEFLVRQYYEFIASSTLAYFRAKNRLKAIGVRVPRSL